MASVVWVWKCFAALHEFKTIFRLFYIFYTSFSTDYIMCDRQQWIHKYLPKFFKVYVEQLESWNWHISHDLKSINSLTYLDPNARFVMFPYYCPYLFFCHHLIAFTVICCGMLYFCAQASVILWRDKCVKSVPLYLQKHRLTKGLCLIQAVCHYADVGLIPARSVWNSMWPRDIFFFTPKCSFYNLPVMHIGTFTI